MLTLTNLLCGFAAIHFALEAMHAFGAGISPSEALTLKSVRIERVFPSYLSIGAGLIILGILIDGIDGVVARLTKTTTTFGGQLDSLADVVTFGVAPPILLLALLDHEMALLRIDLSPFSEHLVGRSAWAAAAVYVACAAVRLARFNVEHDRVDFDHRSFRGLPSPGAAGAIAALLIFQEQAREFGVVGGLSVGPPSYGVVYLAPLLAVSAALLMVSRIPYAKVTDVLRGRRPFGQLVVIIVLFALFWTAKALALLIVMVAYVLSGPALLLWRRLADGRRPIVASERADRVADDRGSKHGSVQGPSR
jgi:CDP-diacylglycerol--serine O-phosphatidyltransferase